jgi:ABC-2 type transport system ATP-binding protein
VNAGLLDVTLTLDGVPALRDVTIELPAGRTTAVIGGDGAGKTTTARTLVGLIQPERGRVVRPDRVEIGYQPEAAGTWPDMTVTENLAFVARSHRLGSTGQARIDELVEVTRLGDARRRLAADLSGGMRQKLAVAMAMLARPRLLVLDEPTTGLDPLSRLELWRLVTHAAGEGAAVLVTTTYLDEAERAGAVVVLDEGAVLATGTAASIRAGLDGTVVESTARPTGARAAWRRGDRWHGWWPPGEQPRDGDGLERIAPDLTDVVTVAAMRRVAP